MTDESHTSREPNLWNSPNKPDSQGHGSDSNDAHARSSDVWNDAVVTDQDTDDLLRPKSMESLLRLREQVEAAAEELVRLRQENAALRERLEELENYVPSDPSEGALLVLDEDPESTRRKVEHFIAAIDRYLARHQTQS